MLRVEHITAGYAKKQVLTDITFDIRSGEIVLLSGGNGSGKSTLLKVLYGLIKPWNDNGRIIFDGESITSLSCEHMLRHGIVYVPQKKNVYEDLTVRENLLISANIYSRKESNERIRNVFEILPMLEKRRSSIPLKMSGGERQLLAFGSALIHTPKLMMLDEPLAGVDSENSKLLLSIIQKQNKLNTSFIIVEHKVEVFQDLITKKIELELGNIKK